MGSAGCYPRYGVTGVPPELLCICLRNKIILYLFFIVWIWKCRRWIPWVFRWKACQMSCKSDNFYIGNTNSLCQITPICMIFGMISSEKHEASIRVTSLSIRWRKELLNTLQCIFDSRLRELDLNSLRLAQDSYLFPEKAIKIRWSTAGVVLATGYQAASCDGVAPESPCIICAMCDPTTFRLIGLREVGRKFDHYQNTRPRGIRFTLIIVHVCFVIKCFYRLLNSITGIQTSTLLQCTVHTARGETQ